MPRGRVHGIHESTFGQWYAKVPPVTRALLTVYAVGGVAAALGALPLRAMYLDWRLVRRFALRPALALPQPWRLATAFMFLGRPSIFFLMQLVWLVQYGSAYEAARFGGNAADALTMLGVGAGTVLALDAALPSVFRAPFHGAPLVFMMLYLWSRRNPDAQVSLMGLVRLQAVYLPWALMGIGLLQGAPLAPDLAGVLAGHVYWFLTEAYPAAGGRALVRTPRWLARACLAHGIGTAHGPEAAPSAAHPGNARFRAFVGRGAHTGVAPAPAPAPAAPAAGAGAAAAAAAAAARARAANAGAAAGGFRPFTGQGRRLAD